jgi:hypothetical protein
MIRRAAILVTVVIALTLGASRTAPAYGKRFYASAQNFQNYCRELKKSGVSLGPVERMFLSLILTGSSTPMPKIQAAPPQPT